MTDYTLPAPLLDPSTLPPVILTSEPGSFAHNTLKVRVPGILRDTIAANAFPADVISDLESLHAELVRGVVRGLREKTPDRAFWDAASAPWIGRSWLDVPWYWAEAFFYRRVLEATRYFQSGPTHGIDPFAVTKRAEWAPDVAPAAVNTLLADLPAAPRDRRESDSPPRSALPVPEPRAHASRVEGLGGHRGEPDFPLGLGGHRGEPDFPPGLGGQGGASIARFARLLHASLWGNRTDLSYAVAAHLGATGTADAERSNLLIDDTAAVWAHLQGGGNHITFIADNAGTELLMDLALIDDLLTTGLAAEVHLHVKPQPFFVSDATQEDVIAGIDALPAGGREAQRLAERLHSHLDAGRLGLHTHWFYASSLFYFQLPADLLRDLQATDLVIVKGDANYRRLLGDAHWPPTTNFARAVAYFPAPLVALRTFKSELIVGLAPGEKERLDALDPDWLVNGVRGVIQTRS